MQKELTDINALRAKPRADPDRSDPRSCATPMKAANDEEEESRIETPIVDASAATDEEEESPA
jgi:hypothetical protein